ncbi:MAG: flagellar biosynthesis protein FlhF [Chitinispirillales bacterium]|jgi:flagellar biosynthesis protein FlhF|nr:flagellar biosynthesis protein FlhF [Chitinispirillales bacterium]
MRIKKYVARSMREALLQIKEELGEEAIILKTTKLPKKVFGIGGPDEIEVTAAVDEDAAAQKAAAEKPPVYTPLHLAGDTGVYNRPRFSNGQNGLYGQGVQPAIPEPAVPNVRPYFQRQAYPRQRREILEEAGSSQNGHAQKSHSNDELAALKADVQELKDLVKSVLSGASVGAPKQETAVKEGIIQAPAPAVVADTPADDGGWNVFVKILTDSEVKPEIAERLIKSINSSVIDPGFEGKLAHALGNQFPVSGPLRLKRGQPLVVAFVGPTGSGKTTTLAKLAAHCCLSKSKKISIITADTYRIAAIEQIRIFADLVKVGLQVVFSPDEVPAALAECEGSDVVFVDTAGRSQRNREHMEELKTLLETLRPDETHLVLSATTKDSALSEMVRNYSNVKINRLLFTKLDETAKLGNIFNAVSEVGIPVSYFTTGQSVPDDIELAQAGKFVKKLMERRSL